MIWLALAGAFEMALPKGGEAVVNLVLENQTDTTLKEPWIFVFSKPDWLSVSPDSVITRNLAKGDKVELQLKLRGEPSWFPALRERELRLRVLVRNGEVAPDFIDFKVKEEPAEIASLIPFLLAREYEFTHTLTEHYDYYPIIFLHGTLTSGSYWRTSDPGGTIMTRLEGYEGYKLYKKGFTIEADHNLTETTVDSFYPKRWIFNISYYWWESGEIQPGAAGSKGTILPCDNLVRGNYQMNLNYTTYGRVVATRIDEILNLTYSDRVHIVAHSYGSLVARAAMKWYNCKDKVKRFLSIGGVNHPIDESVAQNIGLFFVELFGPAILPGWWRYGDRAEMEKDILFSDIPEQCASGKPYLDFLGSDWAGSAHYATIAGTIDPTFLDIGNDDGLVNTETVYLTGADFNATHRSAHSSASAEFPKWEIDTYGELSLTASEYSLECIKLWLIDGNKERNGPITVTELHLYPSPWQHQDEPLYAKFKLGSSEEANNIVSVQLLFYWPYFEGDTLLLCGFSRGCSYRNLEKLDDWWIARFDKAAPYERFLPDTYFVRFVIYTLSGEATVVQWIRINIV